MTEIRPQEIKQPKTVEVKLLVPYAIIVVMLIAAAGLITGWSLRSEMNAKVDAEVSKQFERVSKTQ